MNRILLCCAIILTFLCGCSSSNPQIIEQEIVKQTVSETIHINNCGNSSESSQIISKSVSSQIDIGGEIAGGYEGIIFASLSSKYSIMKNYSRVQEVAAAPNTNMVFTLNWTEENRLGEIILRDISGSYSVSIPISVEQISSMDIGCESEVIGQIPTPTEQSRPIQTQEFVSEQKCNANDYANCWEFNESTKTMVWVGKVTSNSYIGQSGLALTKIKDGYSSIVNLSSPMSINICSGSIDNNELDSTCPHILTLSSGTHIIKSPGASGGYVISPID